MSETDIRRDEREKCERVAAAIRDHYQSRADAAATNSERLTNLLRADVAAHVLDALRECDAHPLRPTTQGE